ncbi:MAG: OmpA family protein [Myxococcales bacterium]
MQLSWPLALVFLLVAACVVPQTKYDALARTLAETKAASDAELTDLRKQLANAETAGQERDSKVSELTTARHNLQASLDEATAIHQQLRGELERLGKDVDKVLKERGLLSKALDDAKVRLEELRKAQDVSEARLRLFRDLERRFARMIEGGQLRIDVRAGRFVITVPSDFLFEGERGEIRRTAEGALLEVAKSLSMLPGKRFQVGGHTDNVPPKGRRTALELTAVRAVYIVKFLVQNGVKPESLAAAAYGEFDPVVSNDTAEGRSRNRRIELMLEPSADELVAPGKWK